MTELNQIPACSKPLLPLVVGSLTITCEDNMALMARYPDNYFDLAIVDPPYGIKTFENIKETTNKVEKRFKSGIWNSNVPDQKYFDELMRVSKNQIVWGGNYFNLPPSRCFIFWDKMVSVDNFADGELAWTSFDRLTKKYQYAWGGLSDGIVGRNKKEKSIHPTQKPTNLYKYCLENYAKQGDKILDTHLGSGSIAIACYDYKYNLTACELDIEYFEKAKERIINHAAQQTLF